MSRSDSIEQSPERDSGDPRYCRTHALVSDMFAHAATRRAIADAWSFNAMAWAQLSELRTRIERERTGPRWHQI